jgi:hypothetical protein
MKKKVIVFSFCLLLALIVVDQPTYAQFFSVVFDPTHTAKTVAQTIMEEAEWAKSFSNQVQQIQHAYTTITELRKRYELAARMAERWKTLDAYRSAFSVFMGSVDGFDPYATQGGILQAMEGILDRRLLRDSYQQSTYSLRQIDPNRIRSSKTLAEMASVGIADAAVTQALANAGSVGGELSLNNVTLTHLANDALSNSPEANTEVSLLNRINVAGAYQLKSQQASNAMLISIANTQAALLINQRQAFARGLQIQDHFTRTVQSNWEQMCQ